MNLSQSRIAVFEDCKPVHSIHSATTAGQYNFILLIFIFYYSYGRIEEDGSTNLDEEEGNVDDFDTEPDMEVDDFDTEPDMEIEEVKFVNNLALCRSVVSETIDQLVARVVLYKLFH